MSLIVGFVHKQQYFLTLLVRRANMVFLGSTLREQPYLLTLLAHYLNSCAEQT